MQVSGLFVATAASENGWSLLLDDTEKPFSPRYTVILFCSVQRTHGSQHIARVTTKLADREKTPDNIIREKDTGNVWRLP